MLVHYLNVPSLEDSGKCSPLLCAMTNRPDSMRWSRDDLLNQLKPMCRKQTHTHMNESVCAVNHVQALCVCVSVHSMKCSVGSGDFSIEELVQHILDRQRTKPQPRTHTCLCNAAQGNTWLCYTTVTSLCCFDHRLKSVLCIFVCSVFRREHSSPLQQHQASHHLPQTASLLLHTLPLASLF